MLFWQLLPTGNAVQHRGPHAFLAVSTALRRAIPSFVRVCWAPKIRLPIHVGPLRLVNELTK